MPAPLVPARPRRSPVAAPRRVLFRRRPPRCLPFLLFCGPRALLPVAAARVGRRARLFPRPLLSVRLGWGCLP